MFVYLFIPLVTIAVFTFNEPTTKFNTTWEGFTFDNWLHPFSEQLFTDALIESVKVATVACVLATILGSLIALALGRYRMHGSGADQPAAHPPAHHARDRDGRLAVHPLLQRRGRAGLHDRS